MLARLRYLLSEGFEVSSLGSCDDQLGRGNAMITITRRNERGKTRTRTEIFEVDSHEMDACMNLYLAHVTKRD